MPVRAGASTAWCPKFIGRHSFAPTPAASTSARAMPATSQAWLTRSRRIPDYNKIDRATGPVIVEHPDHQPTGPPGERIEIGAPLIQKRALGRIVMAVNDVTSPQAALESLRITLPQQRCFALLIQRNP